MSEPIRRVVDRAYVREEFRRAFPGEIGELSFPPRALSNYVAHVTRAIDVGPVRPAGLRVVIDAGGGSAGLVLPSLLGAMGPDAYVVNAGMDESRPSDLAREKDQALARLGELVVSSRSAFGVRFDRVGERISLVDDRGHVVDDDRALLIMLDLVASTSPAGAVAVPVSATRVAEEVAAFHGTRIHRTGVGQDAFAAMSTTAPDGLVLAGDGEGRFAITSVGPTADGLAAFALLSAMVARTGLTLGEIDDRIPRSTVVRADVRTPWAAKGTVMREVAALARQRHDSTVDLTDGVKVIEADGSWCLILPHPALAVMRVWAEAGTPAASQRLLSTWTDVIVRAAG